MNLKERLIKKAGLTFLESVAHWGYRLNIDGLNNLEQLRDNNHYPLIMYFNHSMLVDPAIVALLINRYLPKRLDNPIVLPAAISYLREDLQAGQLPIYKQATTIGENMGLTFIPVLQPYRVRDDSPSDDKRKEMIKMIKLERELTLNFIRQIKNLFTSQNPTVIIAPEGHRSDNGQLQPAELGIGAMYTLLKGLKLAENIFGARFIPIGITGHGDFREGIGLNHINQREVDVKIGNPLGISDIEVGISKFREEIGYQGDGKRLVTDFLMRELCRLLPERNWGVYHPVMLQDTVNGRFELRQNTQTGRVGIYDRFDKIFR